jgi:WD40 repeat protein
MQLKVCENFDFQIPCFVNVVVMFTFYMSAYIYIIVFTIAGHNDKVYAASFSPDGNKLVSCGEDKTFKVFDLTSGMQVYTKILDEQLRYT